MKRVDVKQVLWENVSTLMKAKYGRENLTRLATEAKVGPGTVSRIKAQETSVGLDVVEAIARLFKLEPWQLMVPGISAEQAPSIAGASEAWPFPGIDRDQVVRLPIEKRAKIEGYIESVLEADPPVQSKRAA